MQENIQNETIENKDYSFINEIQSTSIIGTKDGIDENVKLLYQQICIQSLKGNVEESLPNQNDKELNYKQGLKFLEANDWKIDCLQHWQYWDDLDQNSKEIFVQICQNELLFKQAQLWLKQDQTRSPEDILKEESFKCLLQFKKFTKWLYNKRHYKKKKDKSVKTIDTFEDCTSCQSFQITENNLYNSENLSLLDHPLPSLSLQGLQNEQDMLKIKSVQTWNNLIKKCQSCSYSERSQLLKQHYYSDPITFVERLKENHNKQYFQNIFSNLFSIVMELPSGHQKTSIFIASCIFYNNEILIQSMKDEILNQVIHQSLQKLFMEQIPQQIIGFLRLLFVNNFQLTDDHLNLISKLLKTCPVTFNQFCYQIKNTPFNLREEVVDRLPIVGNIFQSSFLNLMKETKGEIFLRFPNKYRQAFINLIVYSCEKNMEVIQDFIQMMSNYFYGYELYLEKADMYNYIIELVNKLKQRHILWINNLGSIKQLLDKLVQGIIEQRIINLSILLPCLDGENQCLENEISKAKSIDQGSIQQVLMALNQFKLLNKDSDQIQKCPKSILKY